jgi:transposase
MQYIYGLYKKNVEYLTNKIDEHLFYIGITSGKIYNLNKRAKDHSSGRSNVVKTNIIKKYDFNIKILFTCDTREEAEEREEFLIRWFGKIIDGGILANLLDSAKDNNYNLYVDKETKDKNAKRLSNYLQSEEGKIKNRDFHLTVPYDKVIEYIDEWAKNPFQKQSEFAKSIGVSRCKFKDWIRLYKPEYIGLKNRIINEIFEEIYDENKKNKDLAIEFSKRTPLDYDQSYVLCCKLKRDKNKHIRSYYSETIDTLKFAINNFSSLEDIYKYLSVKLDITEINAKAFYYRNKKKINWDKKYPYSEEEIINILIDWEESKPSNKIDICKKYNVDQAVFTSWIVKYRPDLKNLTKNNRIKKRNEKIDYENKIYLEWLNSGLSKAEFCRRNNIKYGSFKSWEKRYINIDKEKQ